MIKILVSWSDLDIRHPGKVLFLWASGAFRKPGPTYDRQNQPDQMIEAPSKAAKSHQPVDPRIKGGRSLNNL
jgi:hypothetical protein